MSTDTVDFRGALGAFFNTGWASTTQVAWPGRDFNPPKDGSSWVRLTINEADSFQHEIGALEVQFREVGLLIFQVFTSPNKGDGIALTLADQIATIFRRKRITYTDGRALFRAPQVRVIGPDGGTGTGDRNDSAWFQVNVSIPYIRDTLHA